MLHYFCPGFQVPLGYFGRLTHTHLLVNGAKRGHLNTSIQLGTQIWEYTPPYWGYTKYECDFSHLERGYPYIPPNGDLL